MQNVDKIKRITITEVVVEKIEKMIETADLQPGDILPTERELAEMFGVGRSSIREALGVLQSIGVIEKRQGNGTFLKVYPWQVSEFFNVPRILEMFTLRELAQARRLIEEQTITLTVQNSTDETLQNIERLYERHIQAAKTGNSEEIITCDFEFHQAIAEGAQNRFLVEMMDMLRDVLMAANYAVMQEGHAERAADYHKKLVEAIRAGNAEQARDTMHAHLADVERRIMENYQ